jgi:tRNA threonylcarbamoyl adenosine modification protein YjeE
MADPFLVLDLPDEGATEALGAELAVILAKGDVIALSGDLGAGKTTLARALIRAVAGDPSLEVPSPTFTLVQTYAMARMAIAHVDLYRVTDPREIEETGLLDAASEGAVVVEWPERAGALLPGSRLDIALEMAGAGRRARLSGGRDWVNRLARSRFRPSS